MRAAEFLVKNGFFDHIFLVKRFGIKVVCRVRRPSKRPKVVLTCRKQPSGSIKIIAKKSFVCLQASKLASKDISCLVVPFYVTTCDQLIRPFLCTFIWVRYLVNEWLSACFEGDNHKSSNVYDLTKKGLVTKKKWSCSIVISSYQNFSKIDDYNMRIFRGGVLAVTAAFTKRLLIRKSLQAKRPPCLCKLSCSIFLGTIFEYMLSTNRQLFLDFFFFFD